MSSTLASEETCRPFNPVLLSVPDTLVHTLAIRYSNHLYLINEKKYGENYAGISITFFPDGNDYLNEVITVDAILTCLIVLFGFFITLCIVHLFLIYI